MNSSSELRGFRVLPCCAPTKDRARILENSVMAAASRMRATAGSVDEMIRLEGGSFLMGTEDADSIPADGEGPVRSVHLDPFWLDRYPVMNERFREFVLAEKYRT
jgi:sulfatase modifying factor 1